MKDEHKRLRDLPLEERRRIFGVDTIPTAEELKARREWTKRVRKLREEIGPIDIPTDELVNMTPEEVDEKYGRKPA